MAKTIQRFKYEFAGCSSACVYPLPDNTFLWTGGAHDEVVIRNRRESMLHAHALQCKGWTLDDFALFMHDDEELLKLQCEEWNSSENTSEV